MKILTVWRLDFSFRLLHRPGFYLWKTKRSHNDFWLNNKSSPRPAGKISQKRPDKICEKIYCHRGERLLEQLTYFSIINIFRQNANQRCENANRRHKTHEQPREWWRGQARANSGDNKPSQRIIWSLNKNMQVRYYYSLPTELTILNFTAIFVCATAVVCTVRCQWNGIHC